MATFTLPTNFSSLGINASGHVTRVVTVDSLTAVATGGIASGSFAAGAINATVAPNLDAAVSTRATPAQVQAELGTYDAPTKAELDAAVTTIRGADGDTLKTLSDQIDGVATNATTILKAVVPESGTVGATGNDTTHAHLAGLAYADDGLNNRLLLLLDISTGLYHARWIEDWANTGDLATLHTALPAAPEASVDQYWLTSIRRDVSADVVLSQDNIDDIVAGIVAAGLATSTQASAILKVVTAMSRKTV
jgi:hypothetical protein